MCRTFVELRRFRLLWRWSGFESVGVQVSTKEPPSGTFLSKVGLCWRGQKQHTNPAQLRAGSSHIRAPLPEPSEALPEPFNTLPEPSKALPEPPKSLPEPSNTLPEPSRSLFSSSLMVYWGSWRRSSWRTGWGLGASQTIRPIRRSQKHQFSNNTRLSTCLSLPACLFLCLSLSACLYLPVSLPI